MELLLIIPILAIVGILLTRERHSKIEYLKKLSFMFCIGMVAAMVALPFYGPVFGFTAILLNSAILSTLLEFKGQDDQ